MDYIMKLGIPKKLGHIWIGPLSPPDTWMQTWKDKHPDWEYTLYNNDYLNSFSFKTKKLIDEYCRRGQYSGAADLMRLEILYESGGFIAPADSICYHNMNELFTKERAYTVYENEFIRGKLVSPIQASNPKNEFIGILIDEILKLQPHDLDEPWITTGNLFVSKMIEKHSPDIIIFPSHYLIPVHYTGIVYEGNEKVYAKQMFGSTHHSYQNRKTSLFDKFNLFKKLKKKHLRNELRGIKEKNNKKRIELFNINFQ